MNFQRPPFPPYPLFYLSGLSFFTLKKMTHTTHYYSINSLRQSSYIYPIYIYLYQPLPCRLGDTQFINGFPSFFLSFLVSMDYSLPSSHSCRVLVLFHFHFPFSPTLHRTLFYPSSNRPRLIIYTCGIFPGTSF